MIDQRSMLLTELTVRVASGGAWLGPDQARELESI